MKVAWITGGGSGIGLAAAKSLVAAGHTVVISGRRANLLETARVEIATCGPGQAYSIPLDVSDLNAVRLAAESVLDLCGVVDILINSAGINVPRRSWSEVSTDDFANVVQINLNGAMATCRAVLPSMRARRTGLIVNVASWAGRYDATFTGPAYNASKHGLVALSATINMDEGRNGIRACALCPGEVATPILLSRPVPPSQTEMARMLQPEDLGKVILFLSELPPHVCVNELVVSPTWNRAYMGLAEIAAPRSD
ncbi:MAG: SDR family oxidoreductase [Burkholderiaceae bacterium]